MKVIASESASDRSPFMESPRMDIDRRAIYQSIASIGQ
jgi:hypothetical protein